MPAVARSRPPEPACIIGAGPAGLAAAACLTRSGLDYRLLEREDRPAPAWHRHYDRLHLHTPKRHSALPFLPYPRHYPTYPSRRQVIAYLDGYAEHFGIRPRFGACVRSVRREGRSWRVATDGAEYEAGSVIVASGLNATPVTPDWPGRETFAGTVLHSADYRTGAGFRHQRVLVVGFGNSGGEIALDLVEHGATVGLAVRSGVNVVPRDVLGIPLVSLSLRLQAVPTRWLDAVSGAISRLTTGDLGRYGLHPREDGPATQVVREARIPLIDVGTIRCIRDGAIRVHPGIARFTPGGVEFTDGTRAAFDAVVLATGYRPDLRFLDGLPLPEDPSALPIRGAPGPIPGLYFTGFRVTNTGTLREIGLEARQIARAIATT